MDVRQQRFRLGLFVIGASVLLGILAVFFGGTPRVFVSRDHYTIVFTDAPGVGVGTPVRRSGVKIGEVTAVDLDNDTGEVRVEIAVNRKYTLRTTDNAVVSQDLLSRDTTIDFVPQHRAPAPASVPPSAAPSAPVPPSPTLAPPVPVGPPVPVNPAPKPGDKGVVRAAWAVPLADALVAGQQPLGKEPPKVENLQPPPPAPPQPPLPGDPIRPGSTIRGRSPTDARELIGQAQDILPTVQQSLNQIRRLIETMTPRLDEATREIAQLARALRETVPEVRRTNDELRLAIQGLRATGPTLRRTNEELQVAVTNFGRVAERLDVLIRTNERKLEDALNQINELARRGNTLLSDENQQNVTATLRNLQTASNNFENLTKRTDEFLTEGRRTAERFQQTLNRADPVLTNLNQATRPLAERGERILMNLDASLAQIGRVAGGLGELVGPLGRGDGTVQRLFADPSLYNNLNDAALILTRVLPRFDRVVRDLEVFADKIARHPELIGVGGAVRPNAGLKEGPSGILQPPQPGVHPTYRPRQ
jgi:ABC-type transporter Mla subunit MlaD